MPEASDLQPESEFVTVAEAVSRLGVSERSVRRFAGQLPDTARRKRQGKPAEFHLATLAALMGRDDLPDTARQVPDNDRQAPAGEKAAETGGARQVPDSAGQEEATSAAQGLRESALVEQLKSEVEYLRSALAASQQIASQAQQLQLIAERKVGELEGKLLPAMEQKEASGLAGDTQSEVSPSGGGITTPSASEEPKRGFWARLRGRG